jgi:hypothetical protein
MPKSFSVKTSVETVTIPISVNLFDEATGLTEVINVSHTFKFPDTIAREGYQSRLVKVTGRRVKSRGTSEAAWWLWLQCIVSVANYSDLTLDKEGKWKSEFNTPILRIHAERAAERLLEYIDVDEGETEKNSEQSSEQ